MPESISLGPLQLQWSLLGVLLAALAGYAVVSFRLKREDRIMSRRGTEGLADGPDGTEREIDADVSALDGAHEEVKRQPLLRSTLMNIFANGLFVVLLVWKLGFLLKTPSIIWEQPLGLLIYWSSPDMVVLGAVAAAVLVLLQLRKAGIPVQTAADAAAFGILAAYAVRQAAMWQGGGVTELPWAIASESSLFGVHPLGAYALLLSAALGVWLWSRNEPLGTGGYVRDLCTYGGLGLLALSLFKESPKETVFLLTAEQWGFAALALLGSSAARLFGLIQFPETRHTMASGADIQTIAKEQDMMAANDSKAQIKQAQQNEAERRHADDTIQTDKKLNGPNRPST